MGVTIGATGVGNVTLGGSPLAAIHVGTTKVWPSLPSMDIDFRLATEGSDSISTIFALPDDFPDVSTITAIEIIEGPGAGTRFEISRVTAGAFNFLTFYGPTLPGSVNWKLVTRLRIYYTP